jgi:hypothetical protein
LLFSVCFELRICLLIKCVLNLFSKIFIQWQNQATLYFLITVDILLVFCFSFLILILVLIRIVLHVQLLFLMFDEFHYLF